MSTAKASNVTEAATGGSSGPRAARGRKRDPALDGVILDATLAVLAEHGYDGMTIDMVAARAGSARATVYRRWPTKAELVIDAVGRLSRGEVKLDELPDTGTLRGDMTAMVVPYDDDEQRVRMQAVAALLTLSSGDERLGGVAREAGLGPWIEVNRILMQRAIDRGEFPAPADLDTLAGLIPMMIVARVVQQLPITPEFNLALIDGVILPALRGGP